jgi:hypothetical protein
LNFREGEDIENNEMNSFSKNKTTTAPKFNIALRGGPMIPEEVLEEDDDDGNLIIKRGPQNDRAVSPEQML